MKRSFTDINLTFSSQRFCKCIELKGIEKLGKSHFTVIKRTFTVI